ncbi:response regulator [Spirulina subsalsa]|uniref:response regulator n=1 Tax=Spirulina subsalsa TaxID=54311 RepID=UPI0003805A7A|nr:response regulator [Spirulina subsalsa]
MKILVVEDDPVTGDFLTRLLTQHHYVIDRAIDGRSGLDLASSADYDLILLDWLIPHLDGLTLCRRLRSSGYQKPILLLTSKTSHQDVVAGFEAGADDYVTKPYTPSELLARIRALLRRAAHPLNPKILRWGELCCNPATAEVTYQNQLISLTHKEYNVLQLFLENPQRVYSRSAIIDRLWSMDHCPTESAVTTLIKEVRRKLRVAGLPIDPIDTLYGLGYRLKPQEAAPPIPNLSTLKTDKLARLVTVLKQYQDSFHEQVQLLDKAAEALKDNTLTPELHEQAKINAHKLAGSLGTFGYPMGSEIARKLEELLGRETPYTALESVYFSNQVTQLKHILCCPPRLDDETGQLPTPLVLVVDDDLNLTSQLMREATQWGVRIETVQTIEEARQWLKQRLPDVILLDLVFSETEQNGLQFLDELTHRLPQIPVLMFTVRGGLGDRITASRLGAKGFLHKPIALPQIVQTITPLLLPPTSTDAKVMIMDDDPLTLKTLRSLLEPWGLEITTIKHPDQFWEALTQTAPDLLILNLEMTVVQSLELCRVVRQDAEWGDLPIIGITDRSQAQAIQEVFAAGVDDFIGKPVVGPELVTRVLIRIERIQLQHQLKTLQHQEKQKLQYQARIDGLTQIANRRHFEEYLQQVWLQHHREKESCSLLLGDLDYFKLYNDTYGHLAGDRCLQTVAHLLNSSLKRPGDLLARYGGEEFAIILPKTNLTGAVRVAQRIRDKLKKADIPHIKSPVCDAAGIPYGRVTMSLGVSSGIPQGNQSLDQWLHIVDQALYEAKAQGRDRFVCLPW